MLISYRAKKQVTDQGGKIVNEFKLIKGFTYVESTNSTLNVSILLVKLRTDHYDSAEFPADKVHTLQSNEHLNVEADSQVKTQ